MADLYAHNVSDLASNLSGHLASFYIPLASAAQEANKLTDAQTIIIGVSALSLLIHDALCFPGLSPEARAQIEAVAVNIITDFNGDRYAKTS